MDAPSICVVGSVNLDLVVETARLPSPGETVTGGVFRTSPGGKGANQALEARRRGANVTLIAAVGSDRYAEQALELLRGAGVDLSRLVRVGRHTGIALIVVDRNGENQIAVATGANDGLEPRHVTARGFDAVLCQLEIPDDALVEAAAQASGLFVLNAAPARPIPDPVVGRADAIVVNAAERATLDHQLSRSTGLLVVTRGAAGADAFRDGARIASAHPPSVDAVDSVGAGDAFCGTLAVELARGTGVDRALEDACEAGALSATRPGAQSAFEVR